MFGKALIYLGLVLAVAFATLVLPSVLDRLGQEGLARELMSPKAMAAQFAKDRDDAISKVAGKQREFASRSAQDVKNLLKEAYERRDSLDKQLQDPPGLLASVSPREILKRKQAELDRAVVDGESELLESAARRHLLETDLQDKQGLASQPIREVARACLAASQNLAAFKARIPLEQSARNLLFKDEARLQAEMKETCERYGRAKATVVNALNELEQAKAKLGLAASDYATAGERAEAAVAGVILKPTRTYSSILVTAGLLLVAILAIPLLIRLLFYFVLAPFAQRRPAIRLRPELPFSPPSLAQASATSAPITLQAGEALLVRQGYLQSTSTEGAKRTRALLDWRHPFSSLASGLSFLTQIVGDGEMTTISAVRDPLAEVAVLRLSETSACVLHPRALVAVVQPADRPLRITSHWRLFSLHAWLTLQLRYLMFHGPGQLVLKGGRGIRVERAESGRLFGPDQLVGFSPDLSYTVTRTETFWPYFLGQEALFKDRVDAGGGILIIEEAPMVGGRRGGRKGLEGAFDVFLKAFGV